MDLIPANIRFESEEDHFRGLNLHAFIAGGITA